MLLEELLLEELELEEMLETGGGGSGGRGGREGSDADCVCVLLVVGVTRCSTACNGKIERNTLLTNSIASSSSGS